MEYKELYQKIAQAIETNTTNNYEFANSVSEPFFFKMIGAEPEAKVHEFGERKYQGADGVFLPRRRPFFIDVKLDAGVSRARPENNGKNNFAELTKNGTPSSWLGAMIIGGGVGMINWYRQEAFLYDPTSVRRIIDGWYTRDVRAVASSVDTMGLLLPVSAETDIGRKEANIIYKFDKESFTRVK